MINSLESGLVSSSSVLQWETRLRVKKASESQRKLRRLENNDQIVFHVLIIISIISTYFNSVTIILVYLRTFF